MRPNQFDLVRTGFVGILYLILLSGCSISNSSNTALPAPSPSLHTSWAPAGYSVNSDGSIAFKWESENQNSNLNQSWCGVFGDAYKCYFLSVMVFKTCTVNAQAQAFDSNGNVLGVAVTGDADTSDPISLTPSQKGIIVFRIDKGVSKITLSSLYCD